MNSTPPRTPSVSSSPPIVEAGQKAQFNFSRGRSPAIHGFQIHVASLDLADLLTMLRTLLASNKNVWDWLIVAKLWVGQAFTTLIPQDHPVTRVGPGVQWRWRRIWTARRNRAWKSQHIYSESGWRGGSDEDCSCERRSCGPSVQRFTKPGLLAYPCPFGARARCCPCALRGNWV